MSKKEDSGTFKVNTDTLAVSTVTVPALDLESSVPVIDENSITGRILKELSEFNSLEKSDAKQKENDKADTRIRMSFGIDPDGAGLVTTAGIWRSKTELLPDDVIKKIIGLGGDDLLCQILQIRSNHISLFGRPRENRFDIGFDFLPKDKSRLPKDDNEMKKLALKVEEVKEKIWACGGKVKGEGETPSFSQFLKMFTRDGLAYGRGAVEIIRDDKTKFVGFRAADAGTIYRTTKYKEQDKSYRKTALEKLQKLYGKKIDFAKYLDGDFTYAQVIRGKVQQLFTADEMVVHNFYPTTNVEYNGYPLTPIDQAIHAITTHINITMHNKLYFQHGRAARGMIIIKSRGINETVLQTIRSQFMQTINSVKNSHKMPVFGIGQDDQIEWKPIDNSARDMEFQYLSDNNARVILAAFAMSPDEIPGYGHLTRGSNSQSLSESNNEYKLTAARDVGIRPLLSDLQDFVNKEIVPLFDEEVSKLYSLAFCGLDKDSPEKESTRIQQDIQTHLSMNDIFDLTEKDRISKEMGGDVVLNQTWHNMVAPYLTVGEILENFFGRKGAAQDPNLNYRRDPMWFQQQQLIQQMVQSKIQMMMAAQQQGQPQPEQSQEQPLAQSESDPISEIFKKYNIE